MMHPQVRRFIDFDNQRHRMRCTVEVAASDFTIQLDEMTNMTISKIIAHQSCC